MKVERRSFLASLWAGLSAILFGSKSTQRQLSFPTAETQYIPARIDVLPVPMWQDGVGGCFDCLGGVVQARAFDDVEIGDALFWDHSSKGLAKLNGPAQPGHCVALESCKKNGLTTARIIG